MSLRVSFVGFVSKKSNQKARSNAFEKVHQARPIAIYSRLKNQTSWT